MSPVRTALTHFTIDTKASLFTVQAFAAGIIAVVAHSPKFSIRNFSGNMEFDSELKENHSVDVAVQLTSLDLMDEVRLNERREIEKVMFGDVLQLARFPEARYKSSLATANRLAENMYRMNIMGTLHLHGTTAPVALESQVMIGEDTLKAQGSFSISQSEFGLSIASVAGGSLKLKDELKCAYYIVARRHS